MKSRDAVVEQGLAAAAGVVWTKVMEPVSTKLYELESDASRQRENAVRPGASV